MSSNKQQKESPFGCGVTILGGFLFIMLTIIPFKKRPLGKVEKWPSVLISAYIVFVLFAISRTKFKRIDDYLK